MGIRDRSMFLRNKLNIVDGIHILFAKVSCTISLGGGFLLAIRIYV